MPTGLPLPFVLLLLLYAGQRLSELALSRRNIRRLGATARAAEPAWNFPAMVALHVLLAAMPAFEAARRDSPAAGRWFWGGLGLFAVAQVLRYWAIFSLGRCWNQQAVVEAGQAVVASGPYRFIRHPNYLAVLAEFVALPVAGAAWYSLAVLNVLHLPVIAIRIRAEERLLFQLPGYREAMGGKGRLLPRLRS